MWSGGRVGKTWGSTSIESAPHRLEPLPQLPSEEHQLVLARGVDRQTGARACFGCGDGPFKKIPISMVNKNGRGSYYPSGTWRGLLQSIISYPEKRTYAQTKSRAETPKKFWDPSSFATHTHTHQLYRWAAFTRAEGAAMGLFGAEWL